MCVCDLLNIEDREEEDWNRWLEIGELDLEERS